MIFLSLSHRYHHKHHPNYLSNLKTTYLLTSRPSAAPTELTTRLLTDDELNAIIRRRNEGKNARVGHTERRRKLLFEREEARGG
jgi:hypothetical protein